MDSKQQAILQHKILKFPQIAKMEYIHKATAWTRLPVSLMKLNFLTMTDKDNFLKPEYQEKRQQKSIMRHEYSWDVWPTITCCVGNPIIHFMTEWKFGQKNSRTQAIPVIDVCTKITIKLNSLKQQCTLILSQLLWITNSGTACLGPTLQDHQKAVMKASKLNLIYSLDFRTYFKFMWLFTGLSSSLVVGQQSPSVPYYGSFSTMTPCFIKTYKPRSQQSPLSGQKSYIHIVAAVVLQSPSCVQLSETPWTAAGKASLSLIISQSLPKFMFITQAMPSNHLIL